MLDNEDGVVLSEYKLFRMMVLGIVTSLIKHLQYGEALDIPEATATVLAPYLNQLMSSVSDSQRVMLLLDDNMYYRSMRYNVYQLAKKCKSDVFISSD